jgi:anti-anti-sigma factor
LRRREESPAGDQGPLARFEVHEESGVRTIRAHGEIDASNVAELRRATTKLSNEALGVVLDLDQADYIDSATVRLLYELRQRLARRGQILEVVSHRGSNVHRVLELTRFIADGDARPASAAEAAVAIRSRLAPDSARPA